VGNSDIEAARVFHEITKHSYTSVRSSAHYLDWDIKPLPYKIYPDAAAIALPRDFELSAMPTLRAIAGEAAPFSAESIGLESLTRLLFCGGGLTHRSRVGGEDYHFRAAASAGALYPIEIYVAAGEIDGLQAGLYHFSPADLKLRGLRRGDWRRTIARAAAMRPSLASARAVLLMTAIYWRSAWKYRARAYRYCFWDAGTIAANLLAAGSAGQVPAEIVTAFVDSELEALLGIDSRHEGLACLVALGRSETEPAEPPALEPFPFEAIALSSREVTYDDLVKIHAESRLKSREEVEAVTSARIETRALPAPGSQLRFETIDPDHSSPLGATILRRGSTRVFAEAPISREELATIMADSSAHPRSDFPRLTSTYLIVNGVEGMEPGAYYYRRENGSFELLKRGNFRADAGYLCLEQPLGMKCSALVVYAANLDSALGALGNRAYRDMHLEAGILAGRAYLAAYSLGRGATGLTFYDDDTTKFFEPHAAGMSPLLMVALGVPRSAAEDQT